MSDSMGDAESWRRIEPILDAVLDLPEGDRAAAADRLCANDPSLRAEVDAYLDAAARSDTFLDRTVASSAPEFLADFAREMEQRAEPALGEEFGAYRILGKLGEGGMGVVFEAEQKSPRRAVALKLFRARFAAEHLSRRFALESQALGRLKHPGIAQIFEAGVVETALGPQPFFAMELVRGRPLIAHANAAGLDRRARLDLVARICDAVQHAHQRGVIHRDLKPENILVDERGAPKVLDFGVARVADADLRATMLTDAGQVMGTLSYMSPEQMSGDPDEVDARSDVYAIGVILYALLAGRLPYNLRHKPIPEAARTLAEEDPRPLDSQDRTLRGDLSWITMKAIEKDRTRRYGSPSDLAADIGRYLRNEAVIARPPSASYLLGKFVRRHRVGVSAAAALFVGLAAFAVVMAVQARRIARGRNDLQQVVEFQARMLSEADPERMGRTLLKDLRARIVEARGAEGEAARAGDSAGAALDILVRGVNTTDLALHVLDEEILRNADKALGEQFGTQAPVEAELRRTLGNTYSNLGLYEQGEAQLRAAVTSLERQHGRRHPATLAAMANLGFLLTMKGEIEEADRVTGEVLAARRDVLGNENPDTFTSLAARGAVLQIQGSLAAAESCYREALDGFRRVGGANPSEKLDCMARLGTLLVAQDKLKEAEPFYREALEDCRRVLGEDSPQTIGAIAEMGTFLSGQGRLNEAEPLLREALERYRRVLGDDHPATLACLGNLGVLLGSLGKLEESERCAREVLEGLARSQGPDSPEALTALNNVGSVLRDQGKFEEAYPYHRESIDRFQRVLGPDHPATLVCLNNMGVLLNAQGKPREAEPYYRDALERRRRTLGADHIATLRTMADLGNLCTTLGRLDEADSLLAAAVSGMKRAASPNLVLTGNSLRRYGVCLSAQKRMADAEAALLEAHDLLAAALGPAHKETTRSVNELAKFYAASGSPEKADAWRAKLPAEHGRTL